MQDFSLVQKQQMRIIPVQIQANAILAMNTLELQQFLDTEAAENPALVVDDKARCPVCGFLRTGGTCPLCGAPSHKNDSETPEVGQFPNLEVRHERVHLEQAFAAAGQDETFDPFRTVAGSIDLRDYLEQQARLNLAGRRLRIAKYLIDSLDDDGYFRESLYETAERFAASVPEIESVLAVVQTFDPPGIGARDLRECLLIQLRSGNFDGPEVALAERIVSEHWDDLSKLKLKSIAKKTNLPIESVREAHDFIRTKLTPHPASGYQNPFHRISPRESASVVPDIFIIQDGEELLVRVVDCHSEMVKVDETYEHICRSSDEELRRYIKEHVERAKVIVESIEMRKKTLTRVALAVVEHQREFILHGPTRLKPLRQKDIARELGLHESTICRALANKHCRLPSGELVSFDVFFDCAMPVREMISRIISVSPEPLSDSQIAKRLAEQGFVVARRTVAKYRDQLRLLPYQLRSA
ncbi:MAG: RNA polymerase factor sigma-54 [Armatimonadetes bacterium]|nr:RNA polymerase factor sigma-54 [Armatimonadota bacterium]